MSETNDTEKREAETLARLLSTPPQPKPKPKGDASTKRRGRPPKAPKNET